LSSINSPTPRVRVPRHVARLVTRLVVDYFASRGHVVNYFAYAARSGASARHAARPAARRRLLHLLRASGCFGTSCGLSRDSSSTTSPRASSSSTTSPTPRVRVPRHVARLVTRLVVDYFASRWLVVDYFTYAVRPGASARRAARRPDRRRLLRLSCASGCLSTSHGSSTTTSPTPHVRVPRHAARLVTRLVLPLLVDFFAYTERPGVSAHRAARRRLLRLRRAPGCLGTSSGSSRGSSSTTSPTPRVRVPRHVARLVTRLVVDYFASRGSSSTTSPTPRVRVPRHVTRLVLRLVVNYFTYSARLVASARRAACRVTHRRLLRLAQARCRLLRLRRASGCLGTSCGSSRGSSSTTSPRAGLSSTTSPTPCVRVPRHVARLVTRIVVDFFAYPALPGASAHRTAHRRLLRLRHTSGCLGTSRGSSRGLSCRSSSTSSPTPSVRGSQHIVRLVVDYFAYAARPGASARRAARHAARRRLLRLHRVSGCLGTSRGSSRGLSSTTPCAATSSCGHTGSTLATLCVATTCLATTPALLRVRCAPPQHRFPIASHRPLISTSFPN
jgi:hypothetical protein